MPDNEDGRFDEAFKALRENQRRARTAHAFALRAQRTSKLFASLADDATRNRRELFGASPQVLHKLPHFDDELKTGDLHLLFAGCLRLEDSARVILPMARGLSGGFVARTQQANFLFDPTGETLHSMAELGIDVLRDIDVVITSRNDGSMRAGLEMLLARIRAQAESSTRASKLLLFATASNAEDDVFILTSADRRLIEMIPAKPGDAWQITKTNGQCVVKEFAGGRDPSDAEGWLVLRALPAFGQHSSASFLLEGPESRLLYTGDAEFPGYRWPAELWKFLAGTALTVLIANIGTVAADSPQSKDSEADADWRKAGRPVSALPLTRCFLGFEGTLRLTAALMPRVLVVREFGMECVVEKLGDGSVRFRPDKLGVIKSHMDALLAPRAPNTKSVIPGRHEIRVFRERGSDSAEVQERAIVPAFPSGEVAEFGEAPHVFRTLNPELAKDIRENIAMLAQHPRPFILIEGATGAGKSLLARAIAYEVVKRIARGQGNADDAAAHASPKSNQRERGGDPDVPAGGAVRRGRGRTDESWETWSQRVTSREPAIQEFDLATVDVTTNVHGNLLWGWTPGMFFFGDRGHPGRFAKRNGVLILNQLEKLTFEFSKKFTDLLSSWEYEPLGATCPHRAQVRIVFTSNIAFEQMNNLANDLKNRLRARRLHIPSLQELPPDLRVAEIDLFIDGWCEVNHVVLSADAHEALHRIDLSAGAFRCLQELLEHARRIVMSDFGLGVMDDAPAPFGRDAGPRSQTVFVTGNDIERAMRQEGIRFVKKTPPTNAKIAEVLALKIAIWLSFNCRNNKVYGCLRAGNGRAPGHFTRVLADFGICFDNVEAAWDFFTNTDALDRLREAVHVEGWLASLPLAHDTFDRARFFDVDDYSKWTTERLDALKKLLLAAGPSKNRLKQQFCARIGEASRALHRGM